jgi:hypothetical protein
MRSLWNGSLVLVAGAGLAALAALPARAGETRGPAIGANRYQAAIANNPGEADVDDYVALLVAGEKLSVQLSVPKGSELVPSLELVGPDGALRTVPVRAARSGRALAIRSFKTDAPGRWAVRVRGVGGSEGAYAIAFQTAKTPPTLKQRVTASFGAEAEVTFDAGAGLLADVSVTWKKGAKPLEIASLLDWTGYDAFEASGGASHVDVKGTTATVTGIALGRANGTYRLRLRGADGALASGTVSVRLRRPEWPSGKASVQLLDEPCITSGQNLLGIAGRSVRIGGLRLVPGVRVFFGQNEATNVSYMAGGTEAFAQVPSGVPGSVVDLAVVGADGQACVRENSFTYVPQPKVSAVTRLDGSAVTGWSTKGGLQIRLTGECFRTGQEVRFPGKVDAVPQVVSANEMTVTVPIGQPGNDYLVVVDEWDQEGRSPQKFEMKTPPSFASSPFAPAVAAVQRSVEITIRGAGFERGDALLVDGVAVTSQYVDTTTRRFTFPARDAGDYAVKLRDRLGVEVDGPYFAVKTPPTVESVTVMSGMTIGGGLPASGGNVIRVTGTGFHSTDTVFVGGTQVSQTLIETSTFDFTAPAGQIGPATLKIVDGADQMAVVDDAVTYVGFADATAARVPEAGDADDFDAVRGLMSDLDGDGRLDVVLSSPPGAWPGWRGSLTRVLLNDGDGRLADRTGDAFPPAYSDPSGGDDWNANALALGDLDDDGDPDLVLAGASPDPRSVNDVRIFENDGAGAFTLDTDSGVGITAHDAVFAYDYWGSAYMVYGPRESAGEATALAIGDVDGDGAADLVVGRTAVETETTYIDPNYVSWYNNPPYISSWAARYYAVNWTKVHAATRVYHNAVADGSGFVDATESTLPSVGGSLWSTMPAFPSRDLALADLDRDGDLDLVLTWDNPMTVTVAGLSQGDETATVATRVLRNDGGSFTDVTDSWMPTARGDEYFQADRLALADLDADGDPDLLLLSAHGVDAWRGTTKHATSAIRILRNDRTRFSDVTSSVMPTLVNGDDWRGRALAVRDVDSDGKLDLLIGTTDALSHAGTAMRSTRWLLQTTGFRFVDASAFLPDAETDSGQADDLLLGDLDGNGDPTLLLLDTSVPDHSENGALFRAFDWKR